MTGATLMADLGAYLMVQWADGIEVEARQLFSGEVDQAKPLLDTALMQSHIRKVAREDVSC